MFVERQRKKESCSVRSETVDSAPNGAGRFRWPPFYKHFAPAGAGRDRGDIISSEIFLFESAVVLSLTLRQVPHEKDVCH